jgi:hypothetical protein
MQVVIWLDASFVRLGSRSDAARFLDATAREPG